MNYIELVLFGWHRHAFYPFRLYSFPLLLVGVALVACGIAPRDKVHVTQKSGQFLVALGAFTFSLAFLFTDWNELTNWFVGLGWGQGIAEHYNWFFGYYGMGVDGIPRELAYYTPFPSALFGIYLMVFGLVLWSMKKNKPQETQHDRSDKEKASQDREQRLFSSQIVLVVCLFEPLHGLDLELLFNLLRATFRGVVFISAHAALNF